jgi:hypothetical protein
MLYEKIEATYMVLLKLTLPTAETPIVLLLLVIVTPLPKDVVLMTSGYKRVSTNDHVVEEVLLKIDS